MAVFEGTVVFHLSLLSGWRWLKIRPHPARVKEITIGVVPSLDDVDSYNDLTSSEDTRSSLMSTHRYLR